VAERAHAPQHESPAISVVTVLRIGAVLGVVVLAIAAILLFARHVVFPRQPLAVKTAARIPPAPRLQARPELDLAALREKAHADLSTYAWLDAAHAFARIPVQRAIDIYVQQHAAASATTRPRPAAGPS
jgi:hypothetical protein